MSEHEHGNDGTNGTGPSAAAEETQTLEERDPAAYEQLLMFLYEEDLLALVEIADHCAVALARRCARSPRAVYAELIANAISDQDWFDLPEELRVGEELQLADASATDVETAGS